MTLKVSGLLADLNEASVRYVVVGGVAVNLHGYTRFTKDLDLVLALDAENIARAWQRLSRLGLEPMVPVSLEQFLEPATRSNWARDRSMVVLHWHDRNDPLRRVDLFIEEPIPFATLAAAAVEASLSGVPVKICSLEHLIMMKEAVGRPQDLLDVQKLRALQLLMMKGPT